MEIDYVSLVNAALREAKEQQQGRLKSLGLPDFDVRGELYRLALEMAPCARQEELDALLSVLNPQRDEIGVDLAAGTGFLTTHLFSRTQSKVFAIDPSEAQLDNIVAMSPLLHPLCISPDNDAILEQIPRGSVDYVTSLGGLHHIADHAQMFKNVARILKPGGRFVAADVCAETSLSRHFDRVVANKCITGHLANWLDEGKVYAHAESNAFTVKRCEPIFPRWRFESGEAMALFFKALHALDIPLAEVEADIAAELGVSRSGGNVLVNWPLFIFELRA